MDVKIGDRVCVGKGKKEWIVHDLWTSHATALDPTALATLISVEGYSGTTVAVDRLTPAERAS